MLGYYGKVEEVSRLIAAKAYPKAVAILRTQLQVDAENIWLRQQLADVLVMSGQRSEAVTVLDSLVDTFVTSGFHQKAIAVVKKMQRLAPDDPVHEERLAFIVRTQEEEMLLARSRPAPAAHPTPAGTRDEAARSAAFQAAWGQTPDYARRKLEDEQARAAAFQAALRPPSDTRFARDASKAPPKPAATRVPLPPEEEIVVEVVEEQPREPNLEPRGLARSPLFGHFSPSDLLAVVRGLALKTCEPGEILVTEGEAGGSLFVLVSGAARVFVRDTEGRSRQVRTLEEGDFFGEVSLVTGQPRTATVTASTPCELLELDQAALRTIGAEHPQVPLVIREICDRRAGSSEELAARGGATPAP